MSNNTSSQKQSLAEPEVHKKSRTHKISIPVVIAVMAIGLLALGTLAFSVRSNPKVWPLELALTQAVQGPHPNPCVYAEVPQMPVNAAINLFTMMIDPTPAIILLGIWIGLLLLARLWLQALTLVVAFATSLGIFTLLGSLVARPRPTPEDGICVQDTIPFNSFPSGHVIHVVLVYGFLLYVSLNPPVNTWRYRWLLRPLQAIALLQILLIGYARVASGEHWLLDVVGGYITGGLILLLFITLLTTLQARQWHFGRRK